MQFTFKLLLVVEVVLLVVLVMIKLVENLLELVADQVRMYLIKYLQ
jgi:hypothetical protein